MTTIPHPSYVSPATVSTGSPSIQMELESLDKHVDELHEYISGLESRVAPITIPMPCLPPQAQASRTVDMNESQSLLLEKVQRIKAATIQACERITALTNRVQL